MKPPVRLLNDITASGLNDPIGADSLGDIPAGPGAYLLLVGLVEAVEFTSPRTGFHLLQPGWYVYAGSARGPGGMRARLARHFRAGKRPHWHVDRLTSQPRVRVLACAAPDSGECTLVANLAGTGRFDKLCPGFGSSDCRRCDSHLLMWTG